MVTRRAYLILQRNKVLTIFLYLHERIKNAII